ncbi:hypothetical protein MRX96_016502 [Rhipicephalus microplus]
MAPAERELFGSASQPPYSMLAEPPPEAGTFWRFSSPSLLQAITALRGDRASRPEPFGSGSVNDLSDCPEVLL